MAARSYRPWLWPSFALNVTTLGTKLSNVKQDFTRLINSVINRKTTEVKSSKNGGCEEFQCDLGLKVNVYSSGDYQGYHYYVFHCHIFNFNLFIYMHFQNHKTFLDFVVESQLSNKLELSEKEILDECRTLIGAAVETSVSLLTLLFKVLSIRQDVQQRVFDEISDIFHGSDRPVTTSDLARYVSRLFVGDVKYFVRQTTRKYPGIFAFGRPTSGIQKLRKF